MGQVSRGTLFPTFSYDFIEAAVLASGILNQDLEAVEPVHCPLDVLAQVIVSMVGVEIWDMDELYNQIKTSYPYRDLSHEQFHLVLNMLGGRYADSRIRELKPRISIDRLDNTVVARRGAILALYMSGGTIPDRGYYHLRHDETNARIGELDEEFVWEASVGQTFTFGTQNWRIKRITHNDVFVVQRHPKALSAPFWKGEGMNRDFHFSMRIAHFLEEANDKIGDPDFSKFLERSYCMDRTSADQLITFLKRQKEKTNADLPHRHHLLIEFVNAGPGSTPGNQAILHTLWGGRVNRPFAMALDAAWEERFGHGLEVYVGNDCMVLLLPHDVDGNEILSLVTSNIVDELLRKRLEGSGYFGARFRECAGRALLLARHKISERMPLWMSRLRSQKLLDAVHRYDDFPILLEAWRTCLQDEFDLEGLRQVLRELESGSITWSEVRNSFPSPMAQSISWRQINEYMYRGDEPASRETSRLREDLIRDVTYMPDLRPAIPPSILKQFEWKRQRLSPGYAPSSTRDLMDWVKERVLIPNSEWELLLKAMERDHGIDSKTSLESVGEKLVRIRPAKASDCLIVALERLPNIIRACYGSPEEIKLESLTPANIVPSLKVEEASEPEEDPDERLTSLLGEWLQFYGPVSTEKIGNILGIDRHRLGLAIEVLLDSGRMIEGQLITDGDDEDICDSENFGHLLRLSRAEAAPSFQPLEIDWLPLFLAAYQGIVKPDDSMEGLYRSMEQILCYPMPAEMWESEVFPARLPGYDAATLDTLLQESELRWIGSKNRRISFCFESDLDLMKRETDDMRRLDEDSDDESLTGHDMSEPHKGELDSLFPDAMGRYDFSTLLRLSRCRPAELADRLWDGVWEGRLTNDTFACLRRGMENRFKVPAVANTQHMRGTRFRRSGSRSGFFRWKNALPYPGNWFRIAWPEFSDDLIEKEERNKDRVRLLLDRYGILFRELLAKELPVFSWGNLFRALRLMELSGEVLSGYFFHGIPGSQFISQRAFRVLQRKLPEERVWWINATDTVSLCGIPLDFMKGILPRRVPGTHQVYHGKRLVLISNGNGKALTFLVPPDDTHLPEYMGPLRHLLTRQFKPLRRIVIETINDEKAPWSPYVDALRTSFEVMVDYRHVVLYRKQQKE